MSLDLRSLLKDGLPPADWLVDHLITRDQFVVLAALAGTGKSVLSYNLAIALASGSPFLGLPTKKARVLYFDEENPIPVVQTYIGWAMGMYNVGLEVFENFRVEHMNLQASPEWNIKMKRAIDSYKPDVIIVDTAFAAFPMPTEGGENAAMGVQPIANILRSFQKLVPGMSIIVLKHGKRDRETGELSARGSKAWHGVCDAVWSLSRSSGAPIMSHGEILHETNLHGEKVRAYGLRGSIRIIPRYTDSTHQTLALRGQRNHLKT